jgi:transposase
MTPQYHSKILDHLGLVAGMYDELEIGEVIDQIIPQDHEKRKVSMGQAVKAMVLNGLGFVNKPLYLVPRFFVNKPVERLVGEGIRAEELNDDVLGRSLDTLYAVGVTELYTLISQHACLKLDLAANFGHMDSTSFHTDGVYNSETGAKDGVIHLTRGYSRDHRPDLNQVMLALIVESQTGIPLLMKPLSGNSSDKQAFAAIIVAHIDRLQVDYGIEYMVADSALDTKENLQRFGETIKWISRVPETIKEAKEAIDHVEFDAMLPLDEIYKYAMLTSTYGEIAQRWMVVHSEAARRRAVKTVTRSLIKQSEQEMQAFHKLCRQEFACAPEAEQAFTTFQKGLKVVTITAASIQEFPRYAKAGRPGNETKPAKYVFQISGALSVAWEQYTDVLKQKSCFIGATNELEEPKLPASELLGRYKDQSSAEKGFRFLKDPMFLAASLYLKTPERIMALLMVMTICLLVYAALEYRMRKELTVQGKTFPNQQGKDIQNPTARWIFQYFVGIHVLIIDNHEQIVLNLTDHHRVIIQLLGERYESFYA